MVQLAVTVEHDESEKPEVTSADITVQNPSDMNVLEVAIVRQKVAAEHAL